MPPVTSQTVANNQARMAKIGVSIPGVGGGSKTPVTSQTVANNQAKAATLGVNIPGVGGGTPSVAPQPQKPVSIVSTSPAINNINNTLVPAMNDGNQAIINQNQQRQQDQVNQQQAQAQAQATKQASTPPPQPKETPEAGFQFAYNQKTGDKTPIPLNTPPPAGTALTPPANPLLAGHTVAQTTQSSDGSTYQQYSDGTYGKNDVNGNFVAPVTAQVFSQVQSQDPAVISQQIRTSLENLSKGAVPLSPAQQAQVNAVNTNLAQEIANQTLANANFTGGTTIAMNLYGMGNSLAGLGQIKASVDSGVQAIANLQNKASMSIASMTSAFQKENYDEMRQSYVDLQVANKSIQDHIDTLHANAEKYKMDNETISNNLRTYNFELQKDAELQTQRTFDNTTTTAQNAFNNANTLQTQKRENALARSTMSLQAGELQKLNDARIGTANIPGGTVMGADGKPDPLKQQAFLANIAQHDAGKALAIKAASEYRLPLTAAYFKSSAGMAFGQLMLQYDPNWDYTQYAARYGTVQDFTHGKSATTVGALNTALQHMVTLNDEFKTLGNSNFKVSNYLANTLGPQFGYNSTAGVKIAIGGETGELAKAFTGVGATNEEQKTLGVVNENSTPEDTKAYTQAAVDLLAGKLNGLNDNYKAGTGQDPTTPLLRQDTVAKLSTLKNEGYKVDIPGVFYSDVNAFRNNTADAKTALDNARDTLTKQNDPNNPPNAENILQRAQINNGL
jgi:hypothetical protein